MSINEEPQKYRAQVGALIVNDSDEILIVQNVGYPKDLWDFVKGGMHNGEEFEDTLKREIAEEIGGNVKYFVIKRSSWFYIYDWPIEKRKKDGLRGAARVSFWVRYLENEVQIDSNEITAYKWVKVSDLEKYLNTGTWKSEDAENIKRDYATLKTSV